ncbi:hypothetical protein SAMN03159341_14314 [Paenibacillus sp. 1_12]|uniref:hypothetical protein n=1 Tax=Paenibacillus sp. 1_12 TaxID=1566278 RepID=UPI0008F24E73|nr:hypothetical protein [Paenibacillus sp. 1_12]SFM52930.1 hypothetical protein SAMN03159341_14314 [Paenibacillus sp. 1_12]
MDEIYDFFSRKSFNKLVDHDYEHNAETIEKHGKYIGVLTKQQTQLLRSTFDMLLFNKNQVEMLMSEYEDLRSDYEQKAFDAVIFLRASKNGVDYNSEDWELYVDVKGHCWIIKKEQAVD